MSDHALQLLGVCVAIGAYVVLRDWLHRLMRRRKAR